jgi:hypothetical protein
VRDQGHPDDLLALELVLARPVRRFERFELTNLGGESMVQPGTPARVETGRTGRPAAPRTVGPGNGGKLLLGALPFAGPGVLAIRSGRGRMLLAHGDSPCVRLGVSIPGFQSLAQTAPLP